MSKFQIGDRVKVEDGGNCYAHYQDFICKYAPTYLTKWLKGEHVATGTMGQVVASARHLSFSRYDGFLCIILADSGKVYIVGEVGLSLVARRATITITTDGRTTTARLKGGKQTVKEAKAVCNSSDTFNLNTGASLALNRLLYGTDYNPDEVKLAQDKPTVREVKRPAKAGEWVKISSTCDARYKNGEVYLVTGMCVANAYFKCDKAQCGTAFAWPHEYVVLENYVPEKQEESVEEKQKCYSGKVVCVDDSHTICFTKGMVYEFKDGFVFQNGGEKYDIRPAFDLANAEKLYGEHVKFIELKGKN